MTLLYADGFETCTADSDLRARGLLGTNGFAANIISSATGVAGSAVALAAQQNSNLAPFQGAQGLVGYWSALTVNSAWTKGGFAFGLSATSNTSAASAASPTSANGIYACAVGGAAPANPAPLTVGYSAGSAALLCLSTITSGFITAYLNTLVNGGGATADAQVNLTGATHYYEFIYKPTATANVFNVAVWIDGVQKMVVSNVALAASNDTTSTLFFNLMPSNGTVQQIDDFYVIQQDGAGVQAPLANSGGQAPHIVVRRPTSAIVSQFTPHGPAGVTNAAAAAMPSLASANAAGEYLSSTTGVRDLYKSSNSVPQSTVVGAITEAYVQSTNPATPFHVGVLSGSSHSDATPAALTPSWSLVQQINEVDPVTSKRWLAASLTASELEVMSTAALGSSSNPNVVLLLAGSQSLPALSTGALNPLTDQSGSNVPLTPINNPVIGSFTPYGSGWSTYFNGSSGLAYQVSSTALSPAARDYTIEFWFLPEVMPQTELMQKGAGASANYEWGLALNGNSGAAQLSYTYSTTGTTFGTLNSSNLNVIVGTWNHYAVTCKSGVLTLWFNGNAVGTVSGQGTLFSGLGSMFIGVNGNSTAFANGFISNFRFVIGSALYTAAFTPPFNPLSAVAGTAFLSCNSFQYNDQSPNNVQLGNTVGTPQTSRLCPFSVFNTQDAPQSTGYSVQVLSSANPYVVAPGNNTYTQFAGAFTVELWYFPLSLGTQELLYNWGSGNAGTSSFILGLNGSGTVGATYGSGGSNASLLVSNAKIVLGQWNHIALVRSAAGLVRFYINGVADTASVTMAGALNSSGAPLCLFNGSAGGNTSYGIPINGYACDLRLVNGTAVYSGTTTYPMPNAPLTAITGTTLLIGGEPANLNLFDSAGNCAVLPGNQVAISAAQPKFNGTSISVPLTIASGPPQVYNQDNVFSFGTGDFTVETWWYLNALPSGGAGFIIDARTGAVPGGWCFGCGMLSGNWLGWYTGATGIQSSTNPPVGQWFHFAAVRHAGVMTQYLNGSPIITAGDATNYSADANLTIGSRYTLNYPWSGYIAELRISLVAQYTAAFTPLSQSFVGF